MGDLTDDLIGHILLRLPVKSLLHFRCVCKAWCALIDTNFFIKQHLDNSAQTNNNNNKPTLIFDNYSDSIYSLGLNPLTNQALELSQPIINPKPDSANVKVLGSCNGLLCLFYESLDDLIVIWNPATRKHVKIPRVITFKPYLFVHGFGYDSAFDDYKVVMFVKFFTQENCLLSQSYVYSLRSDSWRVIDDVPDCFMDDSQRPDALVRGAMHWKAVMQDCTILVVAFDFSTDKYRLVTLPEYPGGDGRVMSHFVSELGGCLSFVCFDKADRVFDVWVMKHYGVTESWTKLLTLSNLEIGITIPNVIPLAYSEIADEVILMLNKKLFWYNLEMRAVKFVYVRGLSTYFRPVIYLESLVCLGHKAEHDKRLGSENEGPNEEHQEEASSWRSRQVD